MKSPLGLLPLALAALVVTGCVGEPDPAPSTPAFTTEAEAFAAAEQTYRNYVDALNHVDLSDPRTFEAVYQWTTDDANAADRKSLSRMHAEELTVDGETRAPVIETLTEVSTESDVKLAVCLDVSDVQLTAPDGTSAVPPDRVNVQSRLVTLEANAVSETKMLIATFEAREGEPTCVQ